jgi:hypothetical protein
MKADKFMQDAKLRAILKKSPTIGDMPDTGKIPPPRW